MSGQPVSAERPKSSGRVFMILFGVAFFCAGAFFLWMTSLAPFLKSSSSSDWQETQCEVTKSEVDIIRGDGGASYRPLVSFEYTYNDRRHESETFDFTSLTRSKSRSQEIVDANPIGIRTTCFVNPDAPEEAVIERKFESSIVGIAVPLVIAAIGLAILLGALFLKDKSGKSISGSAKKATTATSPTALTAGSNHQTVASEHPGDFADKAWDEPQKLKPSQTRTTKFVVTMLVALFWNGFVGTFIYAIVSEGLGNADWFFLLFLIPFALIGIALLVGAVSMFGGLFNPKVELALSTGAIRRGESVDVAWQLSGRTSSIQSLRVAIEGEESATYRRGTSTVSDRNVFCTIVVADTESPEEIEFGSERVLIPADTMHTFSADRNNIKWRIVVHGDIPRWPDIKETFEFRVKP